MDNLGELLIEHQRERPEQIAVATADSRVQLGYRELSNAVASATAQLAALGLRRGETVALVSDNSVEFVIGFLAAVFLGARVAPLNPAATVTELNARLSAVSARAVLHTGAPVAVNAAQWNIGIGNGGHVRITDGNGRSANPSETETRPADLSGSDIALVMFTAGTTSAPKAVPLTHGNVTASVRGIVSTYRLSPQDSTLIVMPLFHGHGLVAGLLATLASGGGAYLPSTGGFSAHRFWPEMARARATWYTAVPTIHRILVERAPHEYPASSPVTVRFLRSCSAPLDTELAVAASATFEAPMIGAYGMTETCHQAASNPLPANGANKTPSAGLPTGVEFRIVGDDGKDVPPGSIGEIWVRGPSVTAGYLNNPAANAASFTEGWFRSGDLASRDTDGYVFIRGRIKEEINRGGEKIAPGEIDAALLANPKVLDAASFGEADSIYGESVHAAVILRPGVEATEDELLGYCQSVLSRFEVPERIHIVTTFPRTAKGSTDRRALAVQFSAALRGH